MEEATEGVGLRALSGERGGVVIQLGPPGACPREREGEGEGERERRERGGKRWLNADQPTLYIP